MARRERNPNSNVFKRKKGTRESYDKILIVCEDTKSSYYYFEALIADIGLSSVNIKVTPGKGSAPINVVKTAIEKSVPAGEDHYDQVYCVIDRDHHESFDRALTTLDSHARRKGVKSKFFPIISYPSFELWILYHHKYTSSPFEYADDVIREIERDYINEYQKSSKRTYEITKGDISTAIDNSKRSIQRVEQDGGCCPSTNIHDLVSTLKGIKI